MKRVVCLLMLFLPVICAAEDLAPAISDMCVLSMRNVYKFYYHSVEPNPDPACKTNKLMSEAEKASMNAMMDELRKNCPDYFIAQVNATLVADAKAAMKG